MSGKYMDTMGGVRPITRTNMDLNVSGSAEYIKRRKKKMEGEKAKGRGLRLENLEYGLATDKMVKALTNAMDKRKARVK